MADEVMRDIPGRDIERYHAAAVELADEARRIVGAALERGFDVKTKSDASLVTDIDRGVELRLRELIERWFPDHGVIGEEYPRTRPDSPFQWSWSKRRADVTPSCATSLPPMGAAS